MRYFGVYLDSGLTFTEHCNRTDVKLAGVTRALYRLMPNLRGPEERKRRLYANVIASVTLYGAPIWADTVASSSGLTTRLRRIQRIYVLRFTCAYRTVSFDIACLLAILPYILLTMVACARKRIYDRVGGLKLAGKWTLANERNKKAGYDHLV